LVPPGQAGRLSLKLGTTRLSLALGDASAAPAFPQMAESGAEISAAALARMLARVIPSAGADAKGMSTYGVRLAARDGLLYAQGHHSARMAITTAPFVSLSPIDVFLPRDAAEDLRDILSGVEGNVRIATVGPALHVMADGLDYTTQVADGGVPLGLGLVPILQGPVVRIDRAALAHAVRVIQVGRPHKGLAHLRGADGGLLIWAESEQGEHVQEVVAATGRIDDCTVTVEYFAPLLDFYRGAERIELWQKQSAKRSPGACPEPICARVEGSTDAFLCLPALFCAADFVEIHASAEAAE
jgi:DNA polymerase III sliding clamp (beta) subunit (PCNA family)